MHLWYIMAELLLSVAWAASILPLEGFYYQVIPGERGVWVKKALSISVGSVERDHKVVSSFLGQDVEIERMGTDGDFDKATALYTEYDGKVDAFGVGGVDLGVSLGDVHYPLHDALRLVKGVTKTPYTDGGGLKNTLERRVIPFVEERIGDEIQPKRALNCTGADRFGLACSFFDAGYKNEDVVFGDLMFALGLPIPIRGGPPALIRLARILMPIVGRLPMSFLYPTGTDQEKHTPKYVKWYNWATVIAGDCIYVKRYSPARMDGKIVVTNTTTARDVEIFRERGVKYLVTTTPRFEGMRSFGTNATEAALMAASGVGRRFTYAELDDLIDELKIEPTILKLN